MTYTLTYIRHAQQTSHIRDPHIKPFDPSAYRFTFDCIVCSPYQRTRETAIALNTSLTPIYVDVRISEYQGGKQKEGKQNIGKPSHKSKMDPSSLQFGPIPLDNELWENGLSSSFTLNEVLGGDELSSSFIQRVDEHFAYVKTLNQNVLIVTHGLVVKYLQEKLFGSSPYHRGRDVPFVGGFTITY